MRDQSSLQSFSAFRWGARWDLLFQKDARANAWQMKRCAFAIFQFR
jgi:hypothetical protein